MATPTTVRNVVVTNLLSGFRFLVEWTLNSDSEGVTAYKVFRSPNQDAGFSLIQTVQSPGTQFIDKVPFTYGAVFYYKVVAVSASGMSSDITLAPAVTDITFDEFEEKPFRSTDVRFDSFIVGETPIGLLNGSNVLYTTSNYFRTSTLAVYYDGLRLARNVGFTEGADQKSFTMTAAPVSGHLLRTDYISL